MYNKIILNTIMIIAILITMQKHNHTNHIRNGNFSYKFGLPRSFKWYFLRLCLIVFRLVVLRDFILQSRNNEKNVF